MPVDRGYSAWCDRCEWNLIPTAKPRPRSLFERLYARIGSRFGRGLCAEMARGKGLRGTPTITVAIAWLIAAAAA